MSEREKRSAARTALALTICLILTFVILTANGRGRLASSTAFAQASPTPSGFFIEWVNPDTDTSTEVSAQAKTGRADSSNYHLVAWINRLPENVYVEFCAEAGGATADCNPTSERITPESTGATQVSDDTFEHFWTNLPAEGAYALTARFFSGGTLLDTDTVAITINNVVESPAPPNSVSEGVEIVDPANGDPLGFYRAPGEDVFTGVMQVAASEGATVVEAKYTISAPGTEPNWKSCGFETKGDAEEDGLRCELDEGDTPEGVNGVAAVAYDDPSESTADQPSQVQGQFREGADAHRSDGYVPTPDEVILEFLNEDGSPAGDAVTVTPGDCSPVLRATVLDQEDNAVAGVNVDLHAQGPDDDIRFVDEDPAMAPNQGSHTTSDPASNCEGSNSGTQGEHDAPAGDDTKHVESTDNTNDAGQFSVRLFHASSGDIPGETQISAWADLDGNDVFCSQEPSDIAAIGWGQGATATGVGSETDACTLPGSSPTPTATSSPTSSPSPSPTEGSPTASPTSSPTPARERVATTLSIRYRKGNFSGTAESRQGRCRKGRVVTVREQRRGPDRRVGTDRTNRRGSWKVRARRARGRHYAVVAVKRYRQSDGTMVICRKDKSPTIRARG